MTKPHDETWTTGEGALSGALYSGDTWIGSFADPKRARLAVQAPRLAQMLLEHGAMIDGEWHNDACVEYGHGPGCEADRATLKAAGALP